MVMMYVRFPMSLRNVQDLLAERGIDFCHETVRLWLEQVRAAVRRRGAPRVGEAARAPAMVESAIVWRRAMVGEAVGSSTKARGLR